MTLTTKHKSKRVSIAFRFPSQKDRSAFVTMGRLLEMSIQEAGMEAIGEWMRRNEKRAAKIVTDMAKGWGQ